MDCNVNQGKVGAFWEQILSQGRTIHVLTSSYVHGFWQKKIKAWQEYFIKRKSTCFHYDCMDKINKWIFGVYFMFSWIFFSWERNIHHILCRLPLTLHWCDNHLKIKYDFFSRNSKEEEKKNRGLSNHNPNRRRRFSMLGCLSKNLF
jgi:hypothetical protein